MKTTVFEKKKLNMDTFKKGATALAVAGTTVLAGALPVFAEGPTGGGGAEDAVISGMTSAASSMTSLVGKAVPIVVPILTAVIVVKFGFKLFKQFTGKAS